MKHGILDQPEHIAQCLYWWSSIWEVREIEEACDSAQRETERKPGLSFTEREPELAALLRAEQLAIHWVVASRRGIPLYVLARE